MVASVTNFGLFIRLTDYHIDGLVHITSLADDFYRYDDVKQTLIGESGARQFRLGDTLTVKVAAVNLDERKIDLVLDDTFAKGPKGKKVKVRTAGKKEEPSRKRSSSKPSKGRGKSEKPHSRKGKQK